MNIVKESTLSFSVTLAIANNLTKIDYTTVTADNNR